MGSLEADQAPHPPPPVRGPKAPGARVTCDPPLLTLHRSNSLFFLRISPKIPEFRIFFRLSIFFTNFGPFPPYLRGVDSIFYSRGVIPSALFAREQAAFPVLAGIWARRGIAGTSVWDWWVGRGGGARATGSRVGITRVRSRARARQNFPCPECSHFRVLVSSIVL